MVNEQRLHEMAKPRDEKAHRKFMLRHKFRHVISFFQDIYLYMHAVHRAIKR